MASGENATPIRVVHNSAGHLLGPARSLGGVIIGNDQTLTVPAKVSTIERLFSII
jgi:hypothetical protein